MKSIFEYFQNGKINDIIKSLELLHNSKIASIPLDTILSALCDSLQLTINQFDDMIANNSPVLRTVKGHTFEVAFQRIFEKNGIPVSDIGGDSDIDLVINNIRLQLKTPNLNGTDDTNIEFKTHKTHGAKSENESMDYYHDITSFADFFVGLVSYKPFKILIIPKQNLPRHKNDNNRIKSPFKINLTKTEFINRFDLLNIEIKSIDYSIIEPKCNELLPLTASKIGLSTSIIIDTIMRSCNFRIWDMSIRGFAREIALKAFFNDNNIIYRDDTKNIKDRGEKADLAIQLQDYSYSFIQVKGCSINNCCLEAPNIKIATETQLTRGRVNDHPTQSRLYMASDFDYLSLCIDPPIAYKLGLGVRWFFCLIPSSCLKRHSKYSNRYASLQNFSIQDIVKYEMTPQNLKAFHLAQ